jgi:hypothetical protein
MTLLKTVLKYFKDFLRKICSVAIKDESETRKISNLKGQIRIRIWNRYNYSGSRSDLAKRPGTDRIQMHNTAGYLVQKN